MSDRVSAEGTQVEVTLAAPMRRVSAEGTQVEVTLAAPMRRVSGQGVMVEYLPDRTTLAPTTALYGYGLREYGEYDTPDVVDVTMAQGDTLDGNQVVMTGMDLVFAYNADSVAHAIHIESAKDPYQRYEDIDYVLDAGKYAVFGPFVPEGWIQANGRLHVDVNHKSVYLGTVRLVKG